MDRRKLSLNLAAVVVAAQMLVAIPTQAQAPAQADTAAPASQTTARAAAPATPQTQEQLQEVTVTAQRRLENVQSVPMSMTVLDSKALTERQVYDIIDYASSVPNLTFGYDTNFGFSNSRSITIRGVEGSNTTGFYLDDTPLPESVDPRIVDVSRIEVLRGPQGTLYGADSEGGTVRLITDQPDPQQFDGRVHASVSDTWNTVEPNYIADGAINVPVISDTLALRIVGLYDGEAGYFSRLFPTEPPFGTTYDKVDNVAADTTRGGSVALVWKPSGAVTVTPRVLYQRSAYNGLPYSDHTTYEVPPPAVAPTNLNLVPDNFVQVRLYDIPEGGYDSWTLYSLSVNYDTGYGTLTSSTSYFQRSLFETEDISDYNYQILGMPFPTPISSGTDHNEFVQEVRFASQLPGPVQFVTGAWFETFTDKNYAPPATAPGLNEYFGGTPTMPAEGLNPLNPDEITAWNILEHYHEPALYGELTYSATDALKLIGGLRAYRDSISGSSWQEGLVYGGPRQTYPATDISQSGVNPKGELDYQLTPDHMVYALASKGFRPGGVTSPVPLVYGCGSELAAIGVTQDETRHFDSDSLWNYEVGSKNEWLDHRLTVNGAVYYIDWKNLQQYVSLPCGFEYVANVGAATSKGAELEASTRPLRSLELSGGVGYEHAIVTQSGAESPQQPGTPVYQVPRWTGNIEGTHTLELTENLQLVSNVNYAYVDGRYSGNNNPYVPRYFGAYDLLNARFALAWTKTQVALFCKNVTNEHAALDDSLSIGAEVIGRPRIVTNQPRTVGLEFIEQF